MEIRTFHAEYQVLYSGQTRQGSIWYLCRNEAENKLYQLFPLDKRFLRDTTIAFLNDEWKKESFQDFEDLFLYEDKLYVAMDYYEGISLEERMKQEPLLYEERLAIGQHALEYIMIQDMSPYFACQFLKPNQLLVTEALELRAVYQLEDVETASGIREQKVWNELASLLEHLWFQERKNKVAAPMEEYLVFLRKEDEKDRKEVYRKYLRMQESMKQMTKEERERPRRFFFRLWDRFKKRIPMVKKILAVLVLLLAVWYLAFTIQESRRPKGSSKELIHYIGTLRIKE